MQSTNRSKLQKIKSNYSLITARSIIVPCLTNEVIQCNIFSSTLILTITITVSHSFLGFKTIAYFNNMNMDQIKGTYNITEINDIEESGSGSGFFNVFIDKESDNLANGFREMNQFHNFLGTTSAYKCQILKK
ncbi:hypothetical protein RYX36_037241 [Vicia faba]